LDAESRRRMDTADVGRRIRPRTVVELRWQLHRVHVGSKRQTRHLAPDDWSGSQTWRTRATDAELAARWAASRRSGRTDSLHPGKGRGGATLAALRGRRGNSPYRQPGDRAIGSGFSGWQPGRLRRP